ncbi:FmdE family protein [Corallococcus exercitus]|uniref:FmdE family protein n=1 Tax=Corallococcus exercitus TaxID=2316736 RepID=UPI0035D447F5
MSVRRRLLLSVTLGLTLGCASTKPTATPPAEPGALERVALVHGGAGPWAVAGYRMGEHALQQLGLPRGSFKLEVIHHSPANVQTPASRTEPRRPPGPAWASSTCRW